MISFKNTPLLSSVTDAEEQRLWADAEIVQAAPGDPLFDAFSITDSFWILDAGMWRVTRRVSGVPHLMFEADRPGTWTGGIPIIDRIAPPKADVLQNSRFIRIPSRSLEEVVARNALVAKRLLEAVKWGSNHIGGLLQASD